MLGFLKEKKSNTPPPLSVDVVLCINCSGCMNGVLYSLQENISHFYDDIIKRVEEKRGKFSYIDQFRVRVIAFRDFIADGKIALKTTDFLKLPKEAGAFEKFVTSLTVEGGGDEADDGLEALALAIKSDWNTKSGARQIIVMLTDSEAHPLRFGEDSPFYPEGMPKDFNELTDWWECGKYIDNKNKRLILFAPEDKKVDSSVSWDDISLNLSNVLHFPTDGLINNFDPEYEDIINVLSHSIKLGV